MSEEKSEEKPAEQTSVVAKSIAAVFAMVIAPVLVTFGVKYSDVIIASLTAKPEAAKSEPAATDSSKSDSAAGATKIPLPTSGSVATASTGGGATSSVVIPASATSNAPSGADIRRKFSASSLQPVGPVVRLFNLTDLSGWYTYIGKTKGSKSPAGKNKDPDGVFRVANGVIRISGQDSGALTTSKEYENYHLTVEYKWGTKLWGNREKSKYSRGSSLLLHCIGRDGAIKGYLPQSINCQIVEGATGNLGCIDIANETNISYSVEAAVSEWSEGSKKHIAFEYHPGSPLTTIAQSSFARRLGNGNDWKNVTGFHRTGDIEKPTGQWNTLECICQADRLTIVLNGIIVNEAVNVKPKRGKISLLSQEAELFVRKVELQAIAPK